MPHVVLERDGLRLEADLSLGDIRELMGVKTSNGHVPTAPKSEQRTVAPASASPISTPPQDGLDQFLRDISDRGREFVRLLKENPTGIEANDLAVRLGYTSPRQIGGLTGGGLAKVAKRTAVNLKKLYRTEITTPNGTRTLTFYPGKLIS